MVDFGKFFIADYEKMQKKMADITKKTAEKIFKDAQKAMVYTGKFSIGLTKTAKIMGNVSKKTVKRVGKGFKWLGKSMFGVLGWVLSLLEGLEVLQPVLDVIQGLIEIFGGVLTMALMPAFMKLFDVLLSPTVIEIITILANLIGSILTPIIGVFTSVLETILPPILSFITLLSDMLQPVIEAFMPILVILGNLIGTFLTTSIGAFMIILEALAPVFDILVVIFAALEPILKSLTPVIEILGKLFGLLVVIGLLPLMYALYGIGMVIAGLIDFFSFGAAKARKGWAGIMDPIIGSLVGSIPAIMAMQHGGLITSPTIALLGEKGPEVVTPVKDLNGIGNNDRIMWALEDNKAQLELINTQLYEFNRLQRNKVRG